MMAGLFEKDIRLLLQRKQTLILFLILAAFMGVTMEGSFVIGYMSIMCAIFTVSTISYDEADNCYPFLMTLPIKVADYVAEKYGFCFFGGFLGWILSVVIYLIVNMSRNNSIDLGSELLMAAMYIPIFIILCSIMISFQLKFGAEKSRIVLMILCGVVAVVSFAGSKLLGNTDMPGLFEKIDKTPNVVSFAICVLIAMIVSAVSFMWCLSFMKKKEY
ncbi:MAG TPA: ABC-2 transporter permease [Lachnospiraceae bacterium]|nr:ABC-2 transporter permease [Lachnospiraceae bacterium]